MFTQISFYEILGKISSENIEKIYFLSIIKIEFREQIRKYGK